MVKHGNNDSCEHVPRAETRSKNKTGKNGKLEIESIGVINLWESGHGTAPFVGDKW